MTEAYWYTLQIHMEDDRPSALTSDHAYDAEVPELHLQLCEQEYADAHVCVSELKRLAKNESNSTKEVLAFHTEGNHALFEKRYSDAQEALEKAISIARNQGNSMAEALISYDLNRVHGARQRWNDYHSTLVRISHLYQELDLVDEKILSLIRLADFYRAFGQQESSVRSLNLAKMLHNSFSEMNHYASERQHHLAIRICLAHQELKYGSSSRAAEEFQRIHTSVIKCEDELSSLESNYREAIETQSYSLYVMSLMDAGLRERAIAALSNMRKYQETTTSEVARVKFLILRARYEYEFELNAFPEQDWIHWSQILLSHGDCEFVFTETLKILKESRKRHETVLMESLYDTYQSWFQSTLKKIPQEFLNDFCKAYEFKQGLEHRASHSYHLKKFIEFSKDLMCASHIDEIAASALKLTLEFTGFERGFVLLYDSHMDSIVAVQSKHKSGLDNFESEGSPHRLLAKNVLMTTHGFVETNHVKSDPFHVLSTHQETITAIGRSHYIVLPLMMLGDGIGAVYLDSHHNGTLQNKDDVEHLENLMSIVAVAINNVYTKKIKAQTMSLAKKSLTINQENSENQKYSFDNFIGVSEQKQELVQTPSRTTNNAATVTLMGESGVGKEMIAKMIHHNSIRGNENFVALNCAAIPENLLESELFGYEKGAFTGADDAKDGLFVTAHGGTLFLDEIGEMPLTMQAKIIRALQEREVQPIGAAQTKPIDVRVICATNRNLEEMVKQGSFREDLYYRINVITIKVPSLRERRDDIPLLVNHALRLYALENDVPQKAISSQAMQFLMNYEWPGNVRELINVMYNLSIFVEHSIIGLKDLEERRDLFRLPIDTRSITEIGSNEDVNNLTTLIDRQELTLSDAKQEFEKLQIARALRLHDGLITSASYHLQMPRPQVSRLVKKYGLKERE